MQSKFSPLTIANFFIEKAAPNGGLGHLKLQKLVYCAHGWWLALAGENPMLVNELPRVWKMGPVFPSLDRRLKSRRGPPITQLITDYDEEEKKRLDGDAGIKHFLTSVWLRYEPYSGLTLTRMTHRVGSPGNKVVAENNGNDGQIPLGEDIPNQYVTAEFERIRGLASKQWGS